MSNTVLGMDMDTIDAATSLKIKKLIKQNKIITKEDNKEDNKQDKINEKKIIKPTIKKIDKKTKKEVKVYDLEGKLQWSGWKPLEVQNIQKANGINPIWSKGMFNVYGHNIQFYTDGYDGYNAKVQFYCFLRDEDGCIVVPEAYSGAITKYAAAEWLMTTGIQANMALANVYMQQARNQRNLQKGEANKQGEPQKRVTYAMTQVATYNTGARFIRQWRYYGGL